MDVLTAIKTRRSVRSYDSRPIPEDVLERLQQALRYAPSAGNFQPWHFIFVSGQELRLKVARAAHDQTWMGEAPLTVVACGLPDEAYKRMGGRHNSADIDVAIALDHLTLVAVAEGLGTCWIGSFDEQRVKRLLGVPDDVKVVAITPVGFPASPDLNFSIRDDQRKPVDVIFSTERYGQR
jgi:nitroreductase